LISGIMRANGHSPTLYRFDYKHIGSVRAQIDPKSR